MFSQYLSYFIQGFKLANKSTPLVFISLSIGLINFIPNLIPESYELPIFLAGIFFLFFEGSYYMVIAKFLKMNQQNQTFSTMDVLTLSLNSIKKLIFPFIVLFILSIILFILFVVFHLFITNIPPDQIFDPTNKKPFDILILTLAILFSLISSSFIYSSIFFSINNNGVFESFKKSVLTSFKHPAFFLILAVAYFIPESINLSIPGENKILSLAITLGLYYFYLVTTAIGLIYYQKKVKF